MQNFLRNIVFIICWSEEKTAVSYGKDNNFFAVSVLITCKNSQELLEKKKGTLENVVNIHCGLNDL